MKIISITGMDGSGKTLLKNELIKHLADRNAVGFHLPFLESTHKALTISGQGSPFRDSWTDRLIFALDNRLAGYEINKLSQKHNYLIMQRGWMDSFVHGAVQGYSYERIAELVQIEQLPKMACSIYLNCESRVAYERIKNDRDKDKFETLPYLERQYIETKRFYENITSDRFPTNLFPEPNFYLDTTHMTPSDTKETVLSFLKRNKIK